MPFQKQVHLYERLKDWAIVRWCLVILHRSSATLTWSGKEGNKSSTLLYFTTESPGGPGTYMIDLGRIKGWLKPAAAQRFRNWDPLIGNPAP